MNDGTLRAAEALDRSPRAWRGAAMLAGGLDALAYEALCGERRLEALLESVEAGSGVGASLLRERLARSDPDAQRRMMEPLSTALVVLGDSDYPPPRKWPATYLQTW